MSTFILAIVCILIGFLGGKRFWSIKENRRVMEILGIPDGMEISSVSFRPVKRV